MFEPIKHEPNQIHLVSGWPGAGKTTYGMTGPSPHYLLCTEGRHNFLTARKADEEVMAVAVEGDTSNRPSKNWFSNGRGKWPVIEDAIEELKERNPGTVVIDSGSDLLAAAVCQTSVNLSRGQDAFPPMLYGQVYGLLEEALSSIRAQHHTIVTAKAKEDYNSGEPVTDIWKKAPYLAEVKIWIEKPNGPIPSGYDERIRVGHVSKGDLEGLSILNPTWQKVTSADRQAVKDEYEEFQLDTRIEKGLASLNGSAPDKPDFSSMDTGKRLNAKHQFVNELLAIHKQKDDE